MLGVVQIVDNMSDSGRETTRFGMEYGGYASDDFTNMDKLTTIILERQYQLDDFGGIKLWLDFSKLDVVLTVATVQSFSVFLRCAGKCRISPESKITLFYGLPVSIKSGEWMCKVTHRFSINHYRLTEPFPPLSPASLSEALGHAKEKSPAQLGQGGHREHC